MLVARAESPAVVSKQLCNLLLSFPSAASGGVQWHTLAQQYEERHGVKLDLCALGHDSPMAAATALLWDVLRIVDVSDEENPVVAVEDATAMTPRPGYLASWPSLYRTLCRIVRSHGAPELHQAPAEVDGVAAGTIVLAYSLPLSQIPSFLKLHWHASFAENQLGFSNDDGTFVRLKNLKHLLQTVARWREQRLSWSEEVHKHTEVDDAVMPYFQVVQCKRSQDSVLRLFRTEATQEPLAGHLPTSVTSVPKSPISTATTAPAARCTVRAKTTELATVTYCTGSSNVTPVGSTAVPSDASPVGSSGTITPAIVVLGSELHSSYGAPATTSVLSNLEVPHSVPGSPLCNGQPGGSVLPGSNAGTLVVGSGPCFFAQVSPLRAAPPLWAPLRGGFALLTTAKPSRGNWLGDRGVIPSGIVQSARARFETTAATPRGQGEACCSAISTPAATPRGVNSGHITQCQSPRA